MYDNKQNTFVTPYLRYLDRTESVESLAPQQIRSNKVKSSYQFLTSEFTLTSQGLPLQQSLGRLIGRSRSSLKCPTSPPLNPWRGFVFQTEILGKCVYIPLAGPGEGLGGPAPLFLDQTEAVRSEKNFFGDRPPLPPYLKVWIRHRILLFSCLMPCRQD